MMHNYARFAAAEAYQDDIGDKISRYMPLVHKYAWHLSASAGPSVDLDDLMQAGLIALTECARRHDKDSEDGFAAYAKLRVRGAMVDLLRSESSISRSTRDRLKEMREAQNKLWQRLGRAPTPSELAEELGMTADAVHKLQLANANSQMSSIDEQYCESDLAFQDHAISAERSMLKSEESAKLAEAVGQLDERLQLVVQLYFVEELNLTEIAEILEVSTPRVHQLKAQALKQMRTALKE